ncbi:MAG: hypothetical protein AAGF95_20205 [Chloroflexota bacterium]
MQPPYLTHRGAETNNETVGGGHPPARRSSSGLRTQPAQAGNRVLLLVKTKHNVDGGFKTHHGLWQQNREKQTRNHVAF